MEEIIGLPVMIGFFAVALVMGIVISRTNFCTMGGVSDWINLSDFGRLGAWFLAMVVAAILVVILEIAALIDLSEHRPPYRSQNFAWLRYLLGGVMFGVGMTLAGGCVSRNLVRFGGGNIKSLVTLAFAAYFAYLMTKTRFFEVVFYSWLHPLSIEFSSFGLNSQDFGSLIYHFVPLGSPGVIRLVLVVLAAILVWRFIQRTRGLRGNGLNIVAGVVIGLAVVAGWYLSAGPLGMAWVEAAEWADSPPVGVGAQSFTFVNPLGEYISLSLELENAALLITVGMMAALGLVLGSLIDSIAAKTFKFTWFASFGDFISNAIGGILMGIGGVLALGCTLGQGVTGMATLAIGSVVTLAAIILSSAVTLKTQYYKLIYEDASVVDSLVSGMVDLKMLPKSMRKLEAL